MSRGPASLVWRDYMNLSELYEKIKSHLDKQNLLPDEYFEISSRISDSELDVG